LNRFRTISFCGLLVVALLALDNSAVSLNTTSSSYLQEELEVMWNELDPAGKDIFFSQIDNRLPQWKELFKEAAIQTDQHWTLLAAISYQESHWNPKAISKTGVRGMMMLTQTTAKEVGITRRTDPRQSIMGGSIYFQGLLERLPDSIPRQDKLWMSIAAYNLGFSYLKEARKRTKIQNRNADSWMEVSKTLELMSKEEINSSMGARIKEALYYVQRVQLYYKTLAINLRNSSI
tara:strand:- start:37997 stop:38698 length:702 start_codon:yes stop_codon:yes gene_type:complete